MTQLKHRIAMGQMLVEGGKPEQISPVRSDSSRRRPKIGCRLIVLPECLDLGWTDPSAKPWPNRFPGRTPIASPKRRSSTDLFVVAGLVERAGERLYNSAVLIDPRPATCCSYIEKSTSSRSHTICTRLVIGWRLPKRVGKARSQHLCRQLFELAGDRPHAIRGWEHSSPLPVGLGARSFSRS